MKSAGELILYKDFNGTDEEIFYPMASIIERSRRGGMDAKEERQKFYECFHRLLEVSASHGFQGNLWHNYLTYLLISNENAYSRACEIRGNIEGSINEIALHDFEVFRYFFEFDLEELGRKLGVDCIPVLLHYERFEGNGKVFNSRIRDRICELSVKLEQTQSVSEFKDCVTEFYRDFGVGKLGLHKAFRVEHHENGAGIVPITNIAHVHLDDLVGYELAKKKLVENTEAFVEAGRQITVFIWRCGNRKEFKYWAIINQYYDKGLRMIEIYKHQFGDLQSVIAQIKNRNYKFIIYMDDLSFEEFEIEYKYLKAVIEGGLEKKPQNVLIYATSNRRHLIRENFSDKEEVREDMHTSDTVQEKLSLVYCFGVSIYFGAPNKKEFQEIVKVLAEKHGISMPQEELLLEANKWELSNGGLSGRTAQQFIDHLLGTMK